MTFEPRHADLHQAVDQARRAQLDRQGGYKKVETDAAGMDRRLREPRHGTHTRYAAGCRCQPCQAGQISYLNLRLRRAHSKTSALRKSRDLWYTRATGHPPNKGRGAAKTKLRAA